MPTKFPKRVFADLGWYVYLYIDPQTDAPFYIGKGKGNRVFDHLTDKGKSRKARRIKEIRRSGDEPIIELLKYNLKDEEQALLVESTAIELLDIDSLTNEVRGHGCNQGARGSVVEIAHVLESKEATIDEPVLLINVTEYRTSMSSQEVYDQTRSAWRVGEKRKKVHLVFCVHQRIIREVYRPEAWLPGGTTKRVHDADGSRSIERNRYEFVGRIAESDIRRKYVGKKVRNEDLDFKSQNPIRYLNVE